jgi:outer membrane protein assembly factor BamB
VWNVATSTPVIISVVPGNAASVAFSADGTTLAVRAEGSLTIWDSGTSQSVGSLQTGDAGKTGDGPVAVSPRGTLIATATSAGVQLWSTPYLTDPAGYLCARAGQYFPADSWTGLALGVPYVRAC